MNVCSSKIFPRPFNLQIAIPPFDKLAVNIIESIENDELFVLDKNDADAFDTTPESHGYIDLAKRARIPISVREWLCTSCQIIRWATGDEFQNPKGCAVYRQNAPDVVFPLDARHIPPGPIAFYGEIILLNESFSSSEESLSFVIAHELTHAFDMLRILVPAIQDWPTFWKTALQEGSSCEQARLFHQYQGLFVDDYGSKNELATVAQFWPTKAKQWFNAYRGNLRH